MTSPGNLPALLSATDLASFQASDPDWFLNAVGEVVRWTICQWHIAPSITETRSCPIGPDGTIMLPSLYVTGVQSVTLNGLLLDSTAYEPHQAGYIKQLQLQALPWPWGPLGPLWPMQSDEPFREYPSPLARFAEVTFTHGYPELPEPVKVVAMQMANRALEMPSGIAKDIQAGPYSIGLGALGVVATEDERRQLGPYTLVRF